MNGSIDDAVAYAQKYLEDVLSFFGLNSEVVASNDEAVIQLSVPSTQFNGFLIGQRGENMRALQHLVSSALKNNNFEHSRVNVDIADYKKQRADRLREKAEVWIKQVQDSGETKELEPMNAADRRVVHQLAVERGIVSESVGESRDRHIVLKKA
ncbi:MAG: spoIIIJ-associated protein [Candidatus Saccharibacteria bacterium]|nr:spoIIIJ-associated protein [Candidatus Saccharibacteria bacterium]